MHYLLPEGQYDSLATATVKLLSSMPDTVANVDAKLASCRCCGQSLMGQALEVSMLQLHFLACTVLN